MGDDFAPKDRHTVPVPFAVAALLSLAGGLHGTVVISPSQPVCMVGEPCSKPDANDVLAFWRHGKRIATARTDSSGHYRITLAPGRYAVTAPRHQGIGRGLDPRYVTVPSARYARLNFTLDIGIR
jgi:hypothetical protein